jgi:hypothetical protein
VVRIRESHRDPIVEPWGLGQQLVQQRVGVVADDAVQVGLRELDRPTEVGGLVVVVALLVGSERVGVSGGVDVAPQALSVPSMAIFAANRVKSRRDMPPTNSTFANQPPVSQSLWTWPIHSPWRTYRYDA